MRTQRINYSRNSFISTMISKCKKSCIPLVHAFFFIQEYFPEVIFELIHKANTITHKWNGFKSLANDQTNLSWSTEEQEDAGAAGSTDIKGDLSSSFPPALFICSIRFRANSQVSRTSWAGSKTKLFFRKGTLVSNPIAPSASAA